MADISSDVTIKEVNAVGGKELWITTPNTADDGDTIAVDIAIYGMSTLLGVLGYIHTTEDSVVVQEQPTTAVSGTTVTLTVGGSTDNKKRFYKIIAE